MNSLTRHTLAGGAFAMLAFATACDRNELPTTPVRTAPSRDLGASGIAQAPPRTDRACTQLTVRLRDERRSVASVTPAVSADCASGLRISLGGTVQYDEDRHIIRVPIVLENVGHRTLHVPARLYGWDDSLAVASPRGERDGRDPGEQEGEKRVRRDDDERTRPPRRLLRFVRADSAIAAGTTALAGAVLWKYDTLLAPAGQPQILVGGARSSVRWIEIVAFDDVKSFTAKLQAEATAIPAAPILVVADTTLTGSPMSDTAAYVGDVITYNFTPRNGYINAAVRIDGHAAPASGTVTADSAYHAITVTADRLITVPAGLEGLYATAQAVLTAADTRAAFQAWLDAAYDHMQSSPDFELAGRQIGDIEFLAFDPTTHYDALRRVDAVLAAHSFRFGPDDAAGPGGAPSGARIGALGARRSVAPLASDTIETTQFNYVNGMATPLSGTAFTMGSLRRLIGTVPGLDSPKIKTYYTYNRDFHSTLPTVEEHRQACFMAWFAAEGRFGANSMPGYMATCMADDSYRNYSDLDLAECVRQVWSILIGRPVMEEDAKTVAEDIQSYRELGRHVVVMPHSQGNLMTNQALRYIADHPVAGVDTTCISVVSMASPVSHGWAVPDTNIAKIVVEFDQIPPLGFNKWPVTSTWLSRDVEARAKKLSLVFGIGVPWFVFQGATTLHYVDTSYLKYEAREKVFDGIKQAYAACTVAKMEIPSIKIEAGQYFQPRVVFLSAFGDTLTREVDDALLFTDNSAIVSYDGAGTFHAVSKGFATITAQHGGVRATGTVEVTSSQVAMLVGSWSGSYRNLDAPSSQGPFSVTVEGGKGLDSHAHMTWYNIGNSTSYVGDLYGKMLSDGTISGYMTYNRAGQHNDFTRYITFSVAGPSDPNTARGSSWDYGTYNNYWLIDLTRVVN